MKKIVINVLIIFILSIIIFTNTSMAVEINIGDIIESGHNFIEAKNENQNFAKADVDMDQARDISNSVFNALVLIAIAVALIVGMYLGIRFMMASVEEKADIKQLLVPYVIGCIIAFGAFSIWKIAITVLSNFD